MRVLGDTPVFREERRLVKAGFFDLHSAAARLADIAHVVGKPVTDAFFNQLLLRLERVASPDTALAAYAAILQAQPSLVPALTRFDVRLQRGDNLSPSFPSAHETGGDRFAFLPGATRADGPIQRLLFVLGASQELGQLMASRPSLITAVTSEAGYASHAWNLPRREVAFGTADNPSRPFVQRVDRLRACYRQQLAAILAWDLTGEALQIQPDVSRALSDLAQAALRQALLIARQEKDPKSLCRFAVIAMGKLGARELNYVSDCDLLFVADPSPSASQQEATHAGTQIAVTLQKICSDPIPGSSEPPLWEIDTSLRPEGKQGPLVRPLASYRAYYEKWADNWEFQALLKARPIAGDQALGSDFARMADGFVWKAGQRPGFVVSCQKMRRRVEENIPAPLREREIKLGRGGLRDVEFTVQMLQLVHGRTDPSLRASKATLPALDALVAGGYISRSQGSRISADYRFERVLEHRQQVWQLRRTHLFPDLGSGNGGLEAPRHIDTEQISSNRAIRRLARSIQLSPVQLVDRFDRVRREVRDIHIDVYYRPLLPAIAAMSADEVSLGDRAALERYRSIGFADPHSASRLVVRLTRGSTRAARINRILLPVLLEWLGEGNNPDMGLLQLSKLEDRFGQGSAYLGFLRDSRTAAQRLCRIISNSRYLGDALSRSIESVTWLGHDGQLHARSRQSLETECLSLEQRYAADREGFATGLRAVRRREIERVGLGWMTGLIGVRESLTAMSDVYDELLRSALRWAVADWERTHGGAAPTCSLLLFAMGRYGGRESNFSSDADLLCFYESTSGQAHDTAGGQETDAGTDPGSCALALLNTIRTLLAAPIGGEQGLRLDFDLRPEGRSGPLVRSIASAARYYASVADMWEHQALLRCRYVAGDEKAARQFLNSVINPLRYPKSGVTAQQLASIRRLKARMETERLPLGIRPARHLKLGPGGLSDVEWTVQLLQLRHAAATTTLQTTGTLAALAAEEKAGLISRQDAQTLRHAWLLATQVRNANYLRSPGIARADVLPDSIQDLSGVAACMPPAAAPANGPHFADSHDGQQLAQSVLTLMRRARHVMEKIFYGYER